MRRLLILGSTGSIGGSTLEVVRAHRDHFEVRALATYQNSEQLIAQAREFRVEAVAIVKGDEGYLKSALPGVDVRVGVEGLLSLIRDYPVERVVSAFTGSFGLLPTLAAVREGREVALANKESIVSGGRWLMEEVRRSGATLIPIDSEHSALFQALQAGKPSEVRRLILTASGGPFLFTPEEELSRVTPLQALQHPRWKMGPKVTIDSSTLMNKGLEVIEAHYLFGTPPEKIEVLIHPESIIHSLVEFVDHSILAQMGSPDMVTPIQYALSYPDRIEGIKKPFDFNSFVKLTFYSPDLLKFRPLKLAYEALKSGESYPPFMSRANELLVEKFLRGEISWQSIGEGLERLMERHRPTKIESFDTILGVEQEATDETLRLFPLQRG